MNIKVADEVWVATALLHRENPQRASFRVHEIVERVDREGLYRPRRPGVQVHASLHCVANRPPNSANYCMLFQTPDGGRRLYRDGDERHPARIGKRTPDSADLPAGLHYLLDWYAREYNRGRTDYMTSRSEASAVRERSPEWPLPMLERPAAITNLQEQIIADASVLGGKPVIRGTRLAVEFVLLLLANGWTHEEIQRNYPGITLDDIRACLAYASAALQSERVLPLLV